MQPDRAGMSTFVDMMDEVNRQILAYAVKNSITFDEAARRANLKVGEMEIKPVNLNEVSEMNDENEVKPNAIDIEKPSLREDLRDVYRATDKLMQNGTDRLIGPAATKAVEAGKKVLRKIKGKILTRSKAED